MGTASQDCAARDVVLVPGGGSAIVGRESVNGGFVMRTGAAGEPLWARSIGFIAEAVAAFPNGDLVIAGYKGSGASIHEGLLMRLDIDGNALWTRYYLPTDGCMLLDVLVSSSGDIVAVGATGRPYPALDGLVIRVAPDGTLTWHAVVGTAFNESLRCGIELPGGDIVAGGSSEEHRVGWSNAAWAVRFDASGSLTWQSSLGVGRIDDVKLGASGEILLAGTMGGANIVALDALNDPMWSRTIGLAPCALSVWTDGSLIACAGTRIASLSPDATVIEWSRNLSVNGGFLSVATDALGVLAVGGLNATSDSWMLRLDRNGDLTAGCVPTDDPLISTSVVTDPVTTTASVSAPGLNELVLTPSANNYTVEWFTRCSDAPCMPQPAPTQFGVETSDCGVIPPVSTSTPTLSWTAPASTSGVEWMVFPGSGCASTPWATGVTMPTASGDQVWPALVPGTWSFGARSLGEAGSVWCDSPLACACDFVVDAGVGCGDDNREPDDACATARDACVDCMPVAHGLCNEDWTVFQARAGVTYEIRTLGSTPAADPLLTLFASDCSTELMRDDNSGGGVEAHVQWTPGSDGPVLVRLTSADGNYGPGRATELEIACVLGCEASWDRSYAAANGTPFGLRYDVAPDGGAFGVDGDELVLGSGLPTNPVPVLARVAADGSPMWALEMRQPSEWGGFKQAIAMPDGGVVAAGFHGGYERTPGHYDPLIVRTDASGNMLWLCHPSAQDDERILALAQDDNGGFVGIGTYKDTWRDDASQPIHQPSMIMVRVRDDGRLFGTWRYVLPESTRGPASPLAGVDVAIRSDGGVLALATMMDMSRWTEAAAIYHLVNGAIAWHVAWHGRPVALDATSDDGAVVALRDGRILRVLDGGSLSWAVSLAGMTPSDVQVTSGDVITVVGSMLLDGVNQVVLAQLAPDGTLLRARRHDATGRWLEKRADGSFALSGYGALRQVRSQLGMDLGCARADDIVLSATPASAYAVSWWPDPFAAPESESYPTTPSITSPTAVPVTFTASSCPGLLRPFEVSPPGSRWPLRLARSMAMTWEDRTVSRSSTFDLYRGRLSELSLGLPPECLQGGLRAGTASDVEPAPPGGGYYVVAGRNRAGRGPLGASSQGDERAEPEACP